jgi:hypothetical protein
MSKKSKPEPSTIVPVTIDPPLAPASVETHSKPVERHSDQLPPKLPPNPTAHPSRRSGRARSRPHRRVRGHDSLIGRRPAIQSISASHRIGKDTTVESELSRQSLTAQFQTWNEKSVEGTIQKGRIIKQGQERLDKEEWKAWVVEDLHLTLWSAGLYVHISEHTILSDPKYWKYLPVGYRSLYELSQIDDDKLLEKITKREVHHDLGRSESVKLKLDSSGKPPKKPLPLLNVPDALAVLQKITRYFRPDNVWQAYVRQNPRPSELPSKEDIEAALRWVEIKRGQMRGKR